MKILILEDHPSIFYVLEKIILELHPDSEIDYHSELDTALVAVQNNAPDFVITDIQIGENKQLDLVAQCHLLRIPFMVFTSHVNSTILDKCTENKAMVIVSKSADVNEVKLGIENLLLNRAYICEISTSITQQKNRISEHTPKVIFTPAEEFVILAQIEGKSTVELSQETQKSKYTIRNQRMKLMEKNDCTMEEIARRYLFWHTKG